MTDTSELVKRLRAYADKVDVGANHWKAAMIRDAASAIDGWLARCEAAEQWAVTQQATIAEKDSALEAQCRVYLVMDELYKGRIAAKDAEIAALKAGSAPDPTKPE